MLGRAGGSAGARQPRAGRGGNRSGKHRGLRSGTGQGVGANAHRRQAGAGRDLESLSLGDHLHDLSERAKASDPGWAGGRAGSKYRGRSSGQQESRRKLLACSGAAPALSCAGLFVAYCPRPREVHCLPSAPSWPPALLDPRPPSPAPGPRPRLRTCHWLRPPQGISNVSSSHSTCSQGAAGVSQGVRRDERKKKREPEPEGSMLGKILGAQGARCPQAAWQAQHAPRPLSARPARVLLGAPWFAHHTKRVHILQGANGKGSVSVWVSG